MQKPLISIIIPVYNAEKYLVKCLDSVVNQTYRSLEIILVDDGSTDKSPEICEEYAENDSRIVVIHKRNNNDASARNVGLDIFKGEYVAFVDSDDYTEPDYIEYLYNLLKDNKVDISCCSYTEIDEYGNYKKIKKDENQIIYGNKNCIKDIINHENITYTVWGKLFPRKLLGEVKFKGICCQEVMLMLNILSKCNTIYLGREPKYFYLIRRDSISRAIDFNKLEHRIKIHYELLAFIHNNFPDLVEYAKHDSFHLSITIIRKIILSNFNPINLIQSKNQMVINFLKNNYKKDLNALLLNNKEPLRDKILAICCFVSIPITIRIYRMRFHNDSFVEFLKKIVKWW